MQLINNATNISEQSIQTADTVMETVLRMAKSIRQEMRNNRPSELSMPQFRAVSVVNRHPGASLSVVAVHLGLTNAATSRMIDKLVKQELLTREYSSEDRRRIILNITDKGRSTLDSAKNAALGKLALFFENMDEIERQSIRKATEILGYAFKDEVKTE